MSREFPAENAVHGTVGFPVGIYEVSGEREDGSVLDLHYHREPELFVARTDGINIILDGESRALRKGQGVYINSGVLHRARTDRDRFGFFAVVFSPEFTAEKYSEPYEKYIRPMICGEVAVPAMLDETVTGLVSDIVRAFSERRRGYELYIKSCLTRVMAELAAAARDTGKRKSDGGTEVVKSVLDLIRERYAEDLTLKDMADCAHLSREYLCRVFRSVSELSPIAYLNRYRIEQSALLLRGGTDSISNVAMKCGFNGSSYFCRQFVRFMKCTPSEYRARIGNEG